MPAFHHPSFWVLFLQNGTVSCVGCGFWPLSTKKGLKLHINDILFSRCLPIGQTLGLLPLDHDHLLCMPNTQHINNSAVLNTLNVPLPLATR
ncbi:hypothetical protein QBC36DRAFT_332537 [Triangularia setosa]|uniref:Secreted protein n=1 Tax=Triangularia setosa TaxID=2587417 RepID=A0AAN7A785_9PEZI|nr:hypothetical protein QBC36DRAFT_332537 [Podospora setosa]